MRLEVLWILFLAKMGRRSWSAFCGLGTGVALSFIALGFHSVFTYSGVEWMLLAGVPLLFLVVMTTIFQLHERPAMPVLFSTFLGGCLAAAALYFVLRAPG